MLHVNLSPCLLWAPSATVSLHYFRTGIKVFDFWSWITHLLSAPFSPPVSAENNHPVSMTVPSSGWINNEIKWEEGEGATELSSDKDMSKRAFILSGHHLHAPSVFLMCHLKASVLRAATMKSAAVLLNSHVRVRNLPNVCMSTTWLMGLIVTVQEVFIIWMYL